MARSARRGPWLPEEDQALLQLVRTQGANNWVRISQQIQHRSPKQCRERYHQNLKPSLKHDPISAQEGEVIERLVQEMGKRWAEIARRLGNRSDNAVKNWWNGSANRRRRNPTQSTTGFKQVGTRLQPLPLNLPAQMRPVHQPEPVSYRSEDDLFQSQILAQNPQDRFTEQGVDRTSTSQAFPSDSHSASLAQPRSSPVTDRPILTQVLTSSLRHELPPLRPSSFSQPCVNKSHHPGDRLPVSPALSEASQKHVPSLISDSQSILSISPRTVTTPRPGVPAPVEVGHSFWADAQTSAPYITQPTPFKFPYCSEPFPRCHTQLSTDSYVSRSMLPHISDERSKDLRMNVSTLLQ